MIENEPLEKNSGISDIPMNVLTFFHTKGSGTVVTPAVLKRLIGSATLDLSKFDIYTMGKRKALNKNGINPPAFFTKLRIYGKSAERNSVQGLLGVKFLDGYGYKLVGDSELRVMRPTNIDKYVTEDSSPFRKRSVVYVQGHVFSLARLEGFINIPLMDDRVLAKFENKSNAKKREAYARKKKKSNEWAHINRTTMLRENKKVLLGMLLKYKRNLDDNNFFKEFMSDTLNIGLELGKEFNVDVQHLVDLQPKLQTPLPLVQDKVQVSAISSSPNTKKRRLMQNITEKLNTSTLRRVSSDKKW